MTEQQIQEAISVKYVELIVNKLGHKVAPIPDDDGVDLQIREVSYRTQKGKRRYFDSGRFIEVQMKSTTLNSEVVNGELKYVCEAKTYNDLICRRNEVNPLVLIVFILPMDRNAWVKCNKDCLTISKHAYWYIPDKSAKETSNDRSITIKIPETNKLNFTTIPYLFDYIYNS